MNPASFVRWLHLSAEPVHTMQRRIVRFASRSDYMAFLDAWSVLDPAHPIIAACRHLPLIEAVACPVPDIRALPHSHARTWLEADAAVSLLGSARKASAGTKGIPWGVQHLKAPLAWSQTTGYQVRVGVIDTGVDFQHPDLRDSLARGINLLNRGLLPHDDNGHGTHMAGIIAAANQPRGLIGVAPRAIIHPVKAFDYNGSAYVSDIILGIEWCVRHRIPLINMSFGMRNRSKALLRAVANAFQAGVVIVASSGNDGRRKTIDYPAKYPQTVSVGAINRLRRIAPFSNRGSAVDLYAPGDKIVSTWLKGAYHEMSGTSMATAHVTGAIALLLARHPQLTPAEVKTVLRRSMLPIRGLKSRTSGELDVMKMLRAAER